MLELTLWTSRLPLRCCASTWTNPDRPQAQRTLRPQLRQLDERGGVRASKRVSQPPQRVRGGLSIGRRRSHCLRWRARWGSGACSSASSCSATSTPAMSPSSTPVSPKLGRTAHWPARSRRCCSRHARTRARARARARIDTHTGTHAGTHAHARTNTHTCTCTCATHMPCARQSYGRRHVDAMPTALRPRLQEAELAAIIAERRVDTRELEQQRERLLVRRT